MALQCSFILLLHIPFKLWWLNSTWRREKKKEKREQQQQKKHTDDDTDSNWYADKNMQCHTDIGNIKIDINEKKKKM